MRNALIACLACACWGTLGGAEIDFQGQIRPLMSAACFHCHGPDEAHREADLRLDRKQDLFAQRGDYAAVVPGDPEASELFVRIRGEDPDLLMPPPDSGKTLTAEEIELVRTWIQEGANWSDHWAFVPPSEPAIPPVENGGWVRNPIDAFILARLEREGLSPAEEAEPHTLLRRLFLDLTGLPPTIEQSEPFLREYPPAPDNNDAAGDAYGEQVRQLLDSPHYGERWGRTWLDAARYADSDGFEKDKPRRVWMYRDWVINALNRDLPYNQFIVEQIAGDLLPGATQDQIVATGFLRNSMINEEGGIDPEQFRVEAMFDRMDAIGKGILGLTVQCGQCHNHKYDPLTQAEYYGMYAFLNSCHEANVVVYPREQQARRETILANIAAIEHRLQRETPDWRRQLAAWAKSVRGDQPAWTVLDIENANDNAQRYFPQPDGSLLALGYAPTRFSAAFTAQTDAPEIRAFRLELLTDPNLPANGPGRSVDGLLALTDFKVQVADLQEPDKKQWVVFTRASADYSNENIELGTPYGNKEGQRGATGPVDYAIDGKDETAWGIDAGPGRRNQPRKAVFVADKNIAFPAGTLLTIHLVQKHGGWNSDDNQNMNLGRFRVSVSASEDAVADPLPAAARAIVERRELESDETEQVEWERLFRFWRTTVTAWQAANQEIETLWQQHPEGTTQLVLMQDENKRPTHRLARGNFLKPEEEVAPRFPEFLHPLPGRETPNRLDFARWLVDRRSPTTARAVVNRVWQSYFGTGLVETSEDFGLQGSVPSHPELLDWLAVQFMDHGWRIKWLQEQIVTSATYRQASRVTPALFEADPNNRLLARGPRFRVEAEVVRDIALAASGLLDRSLLGPSVCPPAPAFLFQPPASYGPKTWNEATGPDRYRRALYTFRFRSVPFPALATFDAPSGEYSCVRRSRSNTPLQALTTLNEPLFMECARALARHTLADGGSTDGERIAHAFRRCVTRPPRPEELDVLGALLFSTRSQLASHPSDQQSWQVISGGSDEREALPDGTTPANLAAWTVVCRVLLNLDETLTKE